MRAWRKATVDWCEVNAGLKEATGDESLSAEEEVEVEDEISLLSSQRCGNDGAGNEVKGERSAREDEREELAGEEDETGFREGLGAGLGTV